ncbi:TonB-dependent siderophore receptor [Hymenobacter roseosalivarius DSM 11622]|uniref:TonB-dependent siderophore receptor n=1 Tax=Hymenobacter roseosalivarius DSM 11622 TaxID=645990 RepID=A0A1W1UWC8_9BACT|nr:TonB-dependent receptor [Hymenobacter roseosalivarius]SMB85465.1 TonB-dependent siderophore receptor [Hymenobacter roseosalivarius DSM 11622]
MSLLRTLSLVASLAGSVITAQAQQTSAIRGRVTTSDGSPAEAVTVGLKDRGQGTITNSQGEYVLDRMRTGTYTLVVSALGLKPAEKMVTVTDGQSATLDFVLTENAQQLQEVVVSGARVNKFARKQSDYAAKMPLQNLENPQVYNTVGKELLTEQLVFTVDEALRNAPGVQRMWEATGRAGDGGSYYNTRGYIVQSQLRNGLAGNVSGNVDAVNLEKVEIIKGPSATLYGSALTSYGGLINRVTKKPYETFGGEVAAAAGSYGFHRLSADVNTPLNTAKTLAFRLNTAYQYEDNFQGQGFNRNLTIAPSLSFRPTERLTINLDAELYRGRNVGKQIIFFYFPAPQLGASRADELSLDYKNSYRGNGLEQTSRSTNFFGQVNYRLSSAFTSSTNFSASRSFSEGFGSYFYLVPDAVATNNPNAAPGGNFLARADQSTRDSYEQVVEVQQLFNGDFQLGRLRNRVVLGLDFLRIDSNQNFFGSQLDVVPLNQPGFDYGQFNGTTMAALYAAGPPDFTYPITTKINTYSAFASEVLNLTDHLSVLAALRVDRFENQGGRVGSEVPVYNQTALSPKFGVVFQPIKDKVSLFANYQNSFNNRGSYLAYDVALPDSTTQRVAELEQANQWEGGVKVDALEGKLTATLSYYDIRVQNLLRADPRPEAAARFAQTQDGTQRSRGLEFDLVANPFQGFNAVAGFTYNDSRLERATALDTGRRPATASSPYLANLWLSYRLPETALKGFGLGLGGNYASDNKIQNTTASVFVLPAYTVLNAAVFYDQPKIRISAKVDNLTNERYWIGYTTMNPQKLRSFVGSVAYKF